MDVTLKTLTHIYKSPTGDERRVLNIDEWTLPAGRQMLLRGVSGSGKTTLFNIVAGLMQPTEGDVFYGEQALYTLTEGKRDRFRAAHVGYVFQQHYLIDSLSALDNVLMPMNFSDSIPPMQRRKRAQSLLGQLGLSDHTDYLPHQMSTGQRLRVGIARALANQPTLLLADEPTAALDPGNALGVVEILQRTCDDNGATLLVASHDPALTEYFDTVLDLHEGQLVMSEAATP